MVNNGFTTIVNKHTYTYTYTTRRDDKYVYMCVYVVVCYIFHLFEREREREREKSKTTQMQNITQTPINVPTARRTIIPYPWIITSSSMSYFDLQFLPCQRIADQDQFNTKTMT